ncbi:MAG TPA: DUF4288 domain-containing protein [Chloroflexota bacterium]|jgi:hypothetical protein
MSTVKSWFAAKVIFESIHQDARDDQLFEEKIVVLKAASEAEAESRAAAVTTADAQSYVNACGEQVEWRFKEVIDIKPLFDEDITDGTEVYYSFLGPKELKELKRRLQTAPR